jgi:hypothetical protein
MLDTRASTESGKETVENAAEAAYAGTEGNSSGGQTESAAAALNTGARRLSGVGEPSDSAASSSSVGSGDVGRSSRSTIHGRPRSDREGGAG